MFCPANCRHIPMIPSLRTIASLAVAGILLFGTSCTTEEAQKEPSSPDNSDKTAAQLSSPTLVGQWPQGPRQAVAARGTRVYVGHGALLESVDFTAPSRPTVQSRTLFPGPVLDVALVETYAYVAHGSGLGVVDVSNPTRLEILTPAVGSADARGVTISGSHAYVTADSTLRVLDVSDPAAPVEVGTLRMRRQVLDVDITSGSAIVLIGTSVPRVGRELVIVDVATPTRLRTVGSLRTPNYPEHLAATKDYVYLDGEDGVGIVDVSTPNAPRGIGFIEERTGERAYHPTVAGDSLLYFTRSGGLEVADLSKPADPDPLATVEAPLPQAIAVDETQAYLALGAHGLKAIDLSDSDQSGNLGTFPYRGQGGPPSLDVGTDYAYVTDLFSVRVVDVSDPSRPRPVDTIETGANTKDVAVDGSYAYVAKGEELTIIDASASGGATVVGTVPTKGTSMRVAVHGPYAYVGAHEMLEVVDVSEPTAAQIVGSVEGMDRVWGIAVSGSYLYAAGTDSLRVVDVSDPTRPRTVARVSTSPYPRQVVAQGRDLVYVGDAENVAVIDVSDPTAPRRVQTLEVGASWMAARGDRVYVGSPAGMRVMDLADPTHPQLVDRVEFGSRAQVGALAENRAYVGAGGMVHMIAVSAASRRLELGRLDGHAPTGHVAVYADYAYLESERGLRVVDVSDPRRPNEVGFSAFGRRSIYEMTVADATGYLQSGTTFVVLDLSNPRRPKEIARISGSKGIAVDGAYAYTVGDSLQVFDVSDPADPQAMGAYNPGRRFFYSGVAAGDQQAYVLRGSTLKVFDVSRPAHPQLVGSVSVMSESDASADSPTDVVVQGSYAYVNGGKKLHVLDLSDPRRPRVVGAVATGATRNVVVAGQNAYLVSGLGEVLHRIDISDPTRPRRTGVYDPGGQIWGIAVRNEHVYVGGGAAGLYVVTWDGGAHPGSS